MNFYRRRFGAFALGLIFSACAGPTDRVPALLKALKSQDPAARAEAAQKLGDLGPEAAPAIPAVTAALRDREPAVFRAAGDALVRLGPDARPGLLRLAEDPAAWLRCRAVEVLGRMAAAFAAEAAELVPALMRALADHDACVQSRAVEGLARSGNPAVAPLVDSLKNPNPVLRRGAADALGRMPPETQERAVFPLVQDLRGKDEYARGAAELLLSEMGRPAVPYVLELVSDPDPDLRRRSLSILGRTASAEDAVVTALVGRLGDGDRIVRIKAASVLGEIGGRDPRMLEVLLQRLSQARGRRDKNERVGLVAALGHMGPRSREAVGMLISFLSDEDEDVREEASEALMKVGTIEAMNAAEDYSRKSLKKH